MDLKIPNLNGVEITKYIKKKYPDIKIIAITRYYYYVDYLIRRESEELNINE